jgi:hypothetical protein
VPRRAGDTHAYGEAAVDRRLVCAVPVPGALSPSWPLRPRVRFAGGLLEPLLGDAALARYQRAIALTANAVEHAELGRRPGALR